MNSLKSLAMNCGPLSEMIRGRASGCSSTARWFDPSAFGPPTPGAFGTSSKGVIVGPGSEIVSMGLAKHFSIAERARLRFEITGTNMFNTPNYANPATNITTLANVGILTGIGGDVSSLDASGPRNLRLGVRVDW